MSGDFYDLTLEFERKLLSTIKEGPYSLISLSKKLGVRRDIVSGYLMALRNAGRVQIQIIGRSKVYGLRK